MYDYHVHCSFSPDSRASLGDIMDRAVELGLREVAITDHYNPNYPDLLFRNEPLSDDDFAVMCEYEQKYKGKVRLVKGIENGVLLDTIDQNDRAVRLHPYDFVIASFHSMGGCELSERSIFDGRSVAETYIYYYNYIFEALSAHKDYDVLAHINVLERYYEDKPDPSVYWDVVKRILRMIAEEGKGIEINTSNMRYGRADISLPQLEMLELYRECGGETVTLGSDAHKAKDVGSNLDYARELLKRAGFKYFATFKERRPTYIKLD